MSYGIEDIQSCPIDKKNKRYIHLKGDKVANVFNYEGDYKYQMNLQDFGHENDAYIEDDCLYTIDGSSSNYDGLLEVYEYDFQKENFRTNTYDLGKSNSLSLIGGICKYSMRYHLIVAYNLQGNDRLFSNKVQIFTLDKKTNEVSMLFCTDWQEWFVQGTTFINGYLYVVTNMLPEIVNSKTYYRGVHISKFDIQQKQMIDQIEILGCFEPEGLDSYSDEKGTPYLIMGIGSHQTSPIICQLLKMEAF